VSILTAAGRYAPLLVKAATPPAKDSTPEPTMALNKLKTNELALAPPRSLKFALLSSRTKRASLAKTGVDKEGIGAALALLMGAKPWDGTWRACADPTATAASKRRACDDTTKKTMQNLRYGGKQGRTCEGSPFCRLNYHDY
jgi:hypothetical protein